VIARADVILGGARRARGGRLGNNLPSGLVSSPGAIGKPLPAPGKRLLCGSGLVEVTDPSEVLAGGRASAGPTALKERRARKL
jgi:hypothetical protein